MIYKNANKSQSSPQTKSNGIWPAASVSLGKVAEDFVAEVCNSSVG